MKTGRTTNFKFYPVLIIFWCMIITCGYCSASTVDVINAAIQKAGAHWIAGETPLTYMSPEEKKMHLGLLQHAAPLSAQMLKLPSDIQQAAVKLPARFDWRDNNGGNYVTPIKDQAYCGSCWTFAGTAALESAVLIAAHQPGTPLDLSEQVLVSCMGVTGCSGGYIEDPATFFSTTGLSRESCYPYQATDYSCTPCDQWQDDTFKVESWSWVSYSQTTDLSAIKYALYRFGPLSVSFNVFEDFDYYTSGVYSHVWGELMGGHAVLIVGWDDAVQALIVKNSWGPSWGEDGYFRIAYSELNSATEFGHNTLAIEKVALPDECQLTSVMPKVKYSEGAGGSGTVQVSAPGSCPWTASTSDFWITITGGKSGTGKGSVSYSVAPKPDKGVRTGAIAIGSETFTITQGKWVTQTVDARGDNGTYTSLACEANGTVHIAYYDSGNRALKYTTNATGSWVSETVDATGDGGTDIALAIDANGRAHISYYNASDLKYATNASGSWQTAIVDYAGDVGGWSSLALDGQSHAYISYYEWLNTGGGRLKFATNKNGSWETQVVDNASDDVGPYTSMGLDSKGAAHISYYDYDNGVLKYSTNASGSWVASTVDDESALDMYTSLAVDAKDAIHISYFAQQDEFSGSLKYATNASGSWAVETVDARGMSGMYCSLALDSSGSAHISYYYVPTRDLKYATNASGSWQIQSGDSRLNVGKYSSIALDGGGSVHISYLDATDTVLKYATDRDNTVSVYTLYVKMLGAGKGTVTSNPEGIFCDNDCKGAFANDTPVTLKAVPSQGIFTGWSGACSGTGPCTVTMDESKSVSATFDAPCPAVQLMGEEKNSIAILRQLRDRVLVKTPAGKNYVKTYYMYAPELASIMAGNPVIQQKALMLLHEI
ncbi:MAG: hypothetical protein NTZ51_00855, partial [Proteobacteria bacterium]|nr:hypothetical protein [Pseudomonadota bacterium]